MSFFLFLFFHSSQTKTPPPKKKKTDTAKPKKAKKQKKTDKNIQLVQLCSQIVFFNFLGWALKFNVLAENTIKIVVSAFFKQVKIPKN